MIHDSIYVTLSTFAEHDASPLNRLRQSGIPFSLNTTGKRVTPDQLAEEGGGATVLIAGVEKYDTATLARLPVLRCISRCGVGVDAIDLHAARARGISVVNTPDVPTQAVAELTLAMMLGLCRQLPRQSDLVRKREWKRLDAHLLSGRTVGLIGLGRIGRRVCELLKPFKVRLLAVDPLANVASACQEGIEVVTLARLLAAADIVSLHASSAGPAPLLLGEEELASMKTGAMIVNVARGSMVDEPALVRALKEGRLGGAALDVYPEEPYAGALCDLPNVILTPHSATLAVETRIAMELECVDKALRFLTGSLASAEMVI
ncbi:MAG TPA: phosphoglycerate dehydrogenase [Vicinamibacterales bacterium]|nr:phosphoglycerate dehydrogenase [Vicinamibacterales bacterium]